jgi:outer membrane immunogenic protein
MKKLLLAGAAVAGLLAAGAASAADLPSRRMAPAPMAPAFAPLPVFTWTGFYIGANVGYAWNNNDNDSFVPNAFVRDNAGRLVPFTGTFDRGDSDGFLAGVHTGYNMQFGGFVLGVEGDIEGVFGDDDDDDFFGGTVLRDVNGNPIAFSFGPNSLDWQGSIRARLGVAFDRLLVYGTGGWAFGGVSGGFRNGGILFDDNNDDTLTGWTLGAGVEYAFTNNLTTRLEYRYTNFDRDDDIFNNVSIGGKDFDFHTIRAGLTYKF